MSISVITLAGQSVNLVAAPPATNARSVDFKLTDTVASVRSLFAGTNQRFRWPGADFWTMTLTMPALQSDDADVWEAFLLDMRGGANAAQFVDPRRPLNKGSMDGIPLVDNAGAVANVIRGEAVATKGWAPDAQLVLLPNDRIQLGYRYHRVIDPVSADSDGKAVVRVWPTLREVPVNSDPVIMANPMGLFALAANDRSFSGDVTRTTRLSVALEECASPLRGGGLRASRRENVFCEGFLNV